MNLILFNILDDNLDLNNIVHHVVENLGHPILYNIENRRNVRPRNETHTRLQNDEEFFNAFINNSKNSCEVRGIRDEVNDKNVENFTWTNQTTKLLLQKYYERKSKFRDPKMKKKLLWTEIVNEFKIKGYNITEDILDRKMKNLKQSYKSIKDNKQTSTGRGRITWQWYDTMEDLFKEDRTINIGATLSSMINTGQVNNNTQEGFTSSIPSTSIKDDEHSINTAHLDIDYVHSEITENLSKSRSSTRCVKEFMRGSSYISSWLKNCVQFNFDPYVYDIENSNNLDENIIASVKLRKQLFLLYSPAPEILSKQPPKNLKKKAVKSRAMYNLRKRMLDCEERRVEAINKLLEKIDEHNKIQRERNDILKQLMSSQDDNNRIKEIT